MSKNKPNTRSTPENGTRKISWWPVRVIGGLIGVFGISSILYGIGFLILRSHYSFWGIWSGLPYGPTELVDEGGRFLFHLFFLLLDLIVPRSLGISLWLPLIVILVAVFVLIPKRAIESRPEKYRKFFSGALFVVQLSACLVGLLLGWFLLETFAMLLQQHDIIVQSSIISELLKEMLLFPHNVYLKLVRRLFLLGVVVTVALRAQKLRPGNLANISVFISALFLAAAMSLLPLVYGRLIHTASYPTINIEAESGSEDRVLIRATGTHWILWNLCEARTEVIRYPDDKALLIGPEQSLLHTKNLHEILEANKDEKTRCP